MNRKYTHKKFGEDVVFSNSISASSINNLIELFEKHSYKAESLFYNGARFSDPKCILKAHIHHAISQTLICALNQIEHKSNLRIKEYGNDCLFSQSTADNYAKDLMKYEHEDYSMILRT